MVCWHGWACLGLLLHFLGWRREGSWFKDQIKSCCEIQISNSNSNTSCMDIIWGRRKSTQAGRDSQEHHLSFPKSTPFQLSFYTILDKNGFCLCPNRQVWFKLQALGTNSFTFLLFACLTATHFNMWDNYTYISTIMCTLNCRYVQINMWIGLKGGPSQMFAICGDQMHEKLFLMHPVALMHPLSEFVLPPYLPCILHFPVE